MTLVIPAIEIKESRCRRTICCYEEAVSGEVYSSDPAEMAMLWRRENAKVIHVTDFDGLYEGGMRNLESIAALANRVEIPTELLARFATLDECHAWLKGGIYRIIIHDLILTDPEGVRNLVAEVGSSRVVAGAITRNGRLCGTWRPCEGVDCLDFAARAAALGIRRLFFTDRDYEGVLRGPNFEQLRRVAKGVEMPVTAAGGVASVEHLWMIQELEPHGVDSVVIGRAFYENNFACQQLWRDIELAKSREGRDVGVSTSALRDGEEKGTSDAG